jgi:hypothetical protein
MNSASNHQPVIMPVAQRGAQDDCQKFTVGQASTNNGRAAGAASSATKAAAKATSTKKNKRVATPAVRFSERVVDAVEAEPTP